MKTTEKMFTVGGFQHTHHRYIFTYFDERESDARRQGTVLYYLVVIVKLTLQHRNTNIHTHTKRGKIYHGSSHAFGSVDIGHSCFFCPKRKKRKTNNIFCRIMYLSHAISVTVISGSTFWNKRGEIMFIIALI